WRAFVCSAAVSSSKFLFFVIERSSPVAEECPCARDGPDQATSALITSVTGSFFTLHLLRYNVAYLSFANCRGKTGSRNSRSQFRAQNEGARIRWCVSLGIRQRPNADPDFRALTAEGRPMHRIGRPVSSENDYSIRR